jgi:hypothetical protein
MRAKSLLISLVVFSAPTVSVAEVMNNDTVVQLTKAALGDGLIIDKINSEACGYDVSTSAIIGLKKAGLSDNVISAMVRRCATLADQRGLVGDDSSSDPKVRHSPGIYIMESWLSPDKLQLLRPSKSSGLRTTGNGSVLFPLIAKLVIPGPQSHVPAPTSAPVFYFYFNVSDAKVSDFGMENSIAAQSPDEFSLVKFREKNGSREVDVGRASAYAGSLVSLKKGIDPKYTLRFDTEDEGNGIFKVSAERGLEAGEYAFVFTGANGSSRIYDFSVVNAAAAQPVPDDTNGAATTHAGS